MAGVNHLLSSLEVTSTSEPKLLIAGIFGSDSYDQVVTKLESSGYKFFNNYTYAPTSVTKEVEFKDYVPGLLDSSDRPLDVALALAKFLGTVLTPAAPQPYQIYYMTTKVLEASRAFMQTDPDVAVLAETYDDYLPADAKLVDRGLLNNYKNAVRKFRASIPHLPYSKIVTECVDSTFEVGIYSRELLDMVRLMMHQENHRAGRNAKGQGTGRNANDERAGRNTKETHVEETVERFIGGIEAPALPYAVNQRRKAHSEHAKKMTIYGEIHENTDEGTRLLSTAIAKNFQFGDGSLKPKVQASLNSLTDMLYLVYLAKPKSEATEEEKREAFKYAYYDYQDKLPADKKDNPPEEVKNIEVFKNEGKDFAREHYELLEDYKIALAEANSMINDDSSQVINIDSIDQLFLTHFMIFKVLGLELPGFYRLQRMIYGIGHRIHGKAKYVPMLQHTMNSHARALAKKISVSAKLGLLPWILNVDRLQDMIGILGCGDCMNMANTISKPAVSWRYINNFRRDQTHGLYIAVIAFMYERKGATRRGAREYDKIYSSLHALRELIMGRRSNFDNINFIEGNGVTFTHDGAPI